MKHTLWIIVLFGFSYAEKPIPKTIRASHIYAAEMDNAGNVYFIDEKLNLCLSKLKTDTLKKFSVSNYGSSIIIDAANQLEVFLFFYTTGHVVVFDNQLNVQQDIALYTTNNLDPGAFGRSNEGNIWIFDNNTMTLKKISRQGIVVAESVILEEFKSDPGILTKIYDNGQQIVLNDKTGKLFVFNQNLYQSTLQTITGQIVGQDGTANFIKNNKYVIKHSDRVLNHSAIDTLFTTGNNGKIVRVNSRFMLESGDSSLILHER